MLENPRSASSSPRLRRGVAALCFEPPLEAEFRSAYLRAKLPELRTALTLGLALTAVLCVIDWGSLPSDAARLSVALRLGIVVPGLVMALAATHRGSLARHLGVLQVTAAAGVALGTTAVVFAAGPHAAASPITEVLIGLFMIHALLGLRLCQALGVAVPFLLGVIGVRVATSDAAAAVLGYEVVMLGFGQLAAALIGYRLEHAARNVFLERELASLVLGHDAVTGIPNRRAFDTHLHNTARQARRDERPLGVALVEFDELEQYRALHGTQAADVCLRRLAHTVMSAARRPLDFAARYGTAQFALVLYDPSRPFIDELAVQLRNSVALLDVADDAVPARRVVTASIGIGLVGPGEDDPREALELAARALETAVAEGRNRIVLRCRDDEASDTRVVRGPWAAGPDCETA